MNKEKVKVSVVSYINSTPFVFGLENSTNDNLIISKDIPSICAEKLISGQVDIGLIPIAMMKQVPNANIISDFCIGGNGKVASVLLVSNSPIENINVVYQDSQSRTSVALAKILMRDYWKKNVEWKSEPDHFLIPKENEGIVIIGDRALEHVDKFSYCYDLSEHWKIHTGFPFVFACWVANKKIDDSIIKSLNTAFQNGIESIHQFSNNIATKGKITGEEYLTKFIQYHLTEDAKKGMQLFLNLIVSL